MAKINCPRCMGHADVSFFGDPQPLVQVSHDTIQHCAHSRECGSFEGQCPYLARAVTSDPEVKHHSALLRQAARASLFTQSRETGNAGWLNQAIAAFRSPR